MLSRLVELVTARAREVAGAHPANPGPMERLRESVDALGNVLDALKLVSRSASTAADPAEESDSTTDAAPVRPPAVWEAPGEIDPGPPSVDRVTGGAPDPEDPPPAYAPYRDQQTGLHSRAGFDAVAAGELGRCLRHGRPFAVARIRLAGGGGALVREAAACLRRGLRGSDLLGFDGEREFLLALSETPGHETRAIVTRLVGALRTADGALPGAWVGEAVAPEDGSALDRLLRTAGERMAGPAETPDARAPRHD